MEYELETSNFSFSLMRATDKPISIIIRTTFVNVNLPRGGGGGKRHFFSFYICDRTAEDEQVEKKKRIKIRPCIPEILHAKV